MGATRPGTRRVAAALLALTTATVLAAALAVPPLPASAASVTEVVEAACNNTFQPQKFPLTYQVKSTPSANPVVAGATFTVDFEVSLVASASFLNGVYDILGSTAIPITKNKVSIGPLSGATGVPVQATMPSTFTIPAPASIPVAAGTVVPIGTVTGTYVATSGTAKFKILGNAWAPGDTLPSGTGEPGWTGAASNAVLTNSGARTYAQASLAGGVIKPFLVCMAGTWTPSGATYGPPVVAAAGFGAVTVTPGIITTTTTDGSTTTTTGGGSTTTSTTSATTTTSTSVPESTTTSSTVPTSTTTLPPPEAREVTGHASYAAVCTTDITPDEYPLAFMVEGTTRTNISSGDFLDIVDQTWSITVPGELLGLVSGVAGTNSVDALITASVNGKNTSPTEVTADPIAALIGPIVTTGGVTQPLTVTFRPGDVRFQATGGNAEFRMGTTKVVVTLNDALDVTLTCTPPTPSDAFLVSVVNGPPVAVTTSVVTATSGPGSSTGGSSGGSSSGGSGDLARTGTDGRALAIEALAGLLLLQLGYLLWSVVAPSRPARSRVSVG